MGAVPEGAPIVDATWLAAHASDPLLCVIELDVSRAAYDEGHIPGAVLWNAYGDLRDGDYIPIARPELEALLSRSGISPDSTIVFCGYGALLGFWLMKAHGHGDVRVLAGTRQEWEAAFGSLSSDSPTAQQSSYPLGDADAGSLVSRAAVEAAAADPSCVLLDVRSEPEYAGERFWPSGATADAGRAGRVPGAISVPIDLLRNDDDTFKPAAELRRVLEQAGVGGDRRIITYCTIGNRASQAAFALKYLLDYPDVAVYYASWAEWGKAPDTAIET